MRLKLTLSIAGLIVLSCASQTRRPELTVTYVASCGFLVATGDKTVIIDGLLADYETVYYYLPNDSVIDLMREAKEPFDRIDLILVTHAHADHFDAEVAAAHMLNNPGAILVGPPQVDEKLRATAPYQDIESRLHLVPARADSVVEFQLAGIHVKALPSEHAPFWDVDTVTGDRSNRHAHIEHLEYIIDLAGRVLYHCGD
ncbi:MAG: MBL fold metallo-hydrolase, partial [Candidatus Zixiibacteriota bacterium]